MRLANELLRSNIIFRIGLMFRLLRSEEFGEHYFTKPGADLGAFANLVL